MSTYFETKSNDLDQIISRLQSVLREQEEDDHMSGDSMSLIEDYVFPFMNDLKQGIDGMLSTGVVAPFYGTQIFLKISRIMELVMPCGESGDRTRRILLDIIMRMPIQFDAATPVLIHLTLCDFYWNIIEKDTEEMALLAIKGFVDAYASGVGIMLDTEISGRLHKFIVWLRGMYTGAAQCFETQAGRRAEGQNSTPVSSHESVRVLIECCSSMVYTLTQVFSSSAESYLTSIVGDMVSLFSLNDVLSDRVRQNPDLMSDLFEVQVKTLTFISYLCRSMNRRSDFLRSFDTVIAKSCIRLLKSIPVSNINVRRELILNLRSYLYSPESAAAYIPYIDELFDDTIIVGIGKSAHEVLRPIVVSALADFVNTIRDRIPVEKLKRIFGYFCGTMSDSELPVATQYTSARIILNLIDYFFNRGGSRGGASAGTASRKNPAALAPVSLPDGPEILREVLRSLIEKFSSLILFMPNVIGVIVDSLGLDEYAHLSLKRAPVDENKVTPSNIFDENIAGGINVAGGSEILMKLIGKSTIPFGIPLPDLLIEGVREIRSLIRTLLLGVKMILHCLTHRSFGSSTSAGGRTTLNRNDMLLLESMLEDSLKVCHMFSVAAGLVQSTGFDPKHINSSSNGSGRFSNPHELAVACSAQEERDLLEQISSVLQILPPGPLIDLLAKRIGWLIENIQINNQLMSLVNSLIQNPQSMQSVCEVLFGYVALKGEEIFASPLGGQPYPRGLVVDVGVDGVGDGFNLVDDQSESLEDLELPASAKRLLPHSFMHKHPSLTNQIGSLLGVSSNTSYCLGHQESVDSASLVAHVMPSLDRRLYVYGDLVSLYGLRETTAAVDGRDVVITLAKTLSKQVAGGGSSTGTAPGPINVTFLEPIVRPFVVEITMTCFRIGRNYPEKSVHCLGFLRYMFRLMCSGMKTTSSIRELSDSLPVLLELCLQMYRATWSEAPTIAALWLELALTIPVRLKVLVPHFEQVMNLMVAALSCEGDCVSVGLSVLESWVDGLTPDFLFPLIPGHGIESLSGCLLRLTRPPIGHVVHTTTSGNNSIRATKILGKLGSRTKFTLDSWNVIGEESDNKSDIGDEVETRFLLSIGGTSGPVIDFPMSDSVRVALKLLAKHSAVSETLPVSMQEHPIGEEISLVPDQELMDSLNIIMTSYLANRENAQRSGSLLSLGMGLVNACACISEIVSIKAKQVVADLIVTDVQNFIEADKKGASANIPGIIIGIIESLRGDMKSARRTNAALELLKSFILGYIGTTSAKIFPHTLVAIAGALSERLTDPCWSKQVGAGMGIQSLADSMTEMSVVLTSSAMSIIERGVYGYIQAEGTGSSIPSVAGQRWILRACIAVLKVILGDSSCSAVASQAHQVLWLKKGHSEISKIVSFLLTEFTSHSDRTLAEILLHAIAKMLNVSMAALVCWVDPDMTLCVSGLESGPVFKVAGFVLELRPPPVLNGSNGERLHQSLLKSIEKAVEWLENQDELAIVYGLVRTGGVTSPPPGVAPHQHQAYLFQRSVLRKSLSNWTDSWTKVLQAIRVAKLTVLHTQLGASNQVTVFPAHLVPNSCPATWQDRILLTLARLLFSFDYETVSSSMYSLMAISGAGIGIGEQVWSQSLISLAREIASRAPIALSEIQGLGRLLRLLPSWIDEGVRADLTERLFERMHTYLGVLRERTYAPIQQAILQNNLPGGIPPSSSSPGGPVISWRAGVYSDSVVTLAAITLECISGLISDRVLERLIVLSSQLDVSLPGTHGTAQLTSPFIAPLLPSLCRDVERSADQILSRIEIHKVFGFVAELVSLKACLNLRKILQDKFHQMSLMDSGVGSTGGMIRNSPAMSSLISVLARHDPSYLWVQYCSVSALKSSGIPRSVSLIESIVRNWETHVAGLTMMMNPPPSSSGMMCICPGGILGPIDVSNAVTSYEGRLIAWTIMQFVRAPFATAARGVVIDIEQHLNIRVRLLVRLATCLSLRTMIDVSPIQDWFLNEAVDLTSDGEKFEIILKSIEAFQDSSISIGCKYALMKYLVVPQLRQLIKRGAEVTSPNIFSGAPSSLGERIVSILLNAQTNLGVMEEGIRIECVKLVDLLLTAGALEFTPSCSQYLYSSLMTDHYLLRQWSQSVMVWAIGRHVLPHEDLARMLRLYIASESPKRSISFDVRDSTAYASTEVYESLSAIFRADPALIISMVKLLKMSMDFNGGNASLWKWFLLIAKGLPVADISSSADLFRVCLGSISKSKVFNSSASTESRIIGVEIACLVADWCVELKDLATAQLVANLLLRFAILGPEAATSQHQATHSSSGGQPTGTSTVSPTMTVNFMTKCLSGLERCMEANPELRLDLGTIEQYIHIPKNSSESREVLKHTRQLVGLNRALIVYYGSSRATASRRVSIEKDNGHLAHIIGIGMVSTDKSVCQTVCLLIEKLVAKVGVTGGFMNQIVAGIQAGFSVASNNASAGRIRVHAMNPNSPSFLVTPYMAIAVCIAVLRGMIGGAAGTTGSSTSNVITPLEWFTSSELLPSLTRALTQGVRSFVFSLLPQHVHHYPLSGTKFAAPVLDSSSDTATSGAFAYPGVLQGAEYVVPTLVSTIRTCQLVMSTDAVFRNCVMWLVESLGPFLTFASPNQQTFSHLLNALNFTVPQQSQKLSGAPQAATGGTATQGVVGGLASVFSTIQLTALMRFVLVDVIAQWYGVKLASGSSGSDTCKIRNPQLILSLSTSLVGDEALEAVCELGPVFESITAARDATSPRFGGRRNARASTSAPSLDILIRTVECFDGLSILSSLADPSVKKLLGFVPQRAVTCFPGSVLSNCANSDSVNGFGWLGSNVAGLWSSRTCFGGLYSIAMEIFASVVDKDTIGRCLSPILIGAVSAEKSYRKEFLSLLCDLVPKGDIGSKFEWILLACPYSSIGDRQLLSVICALALSGSEDGIWPPEEGISPKKPKSAPQAVVGSPKMAQWNWIDSVISLIQVDSDLAYTTGRIVMSAILGSLGSLVAEERLLNSFITRPFLHRQSLFNRNIVGVILEASSCTFSTPVLVHCAQHYGLYHEVLEILEASIQAGGHDDDTVFEIWSAIESLYRDLNDKDALFGTLILRGLERQTGVAVSYLQQDRFGSSRDILEATMNSITPEDQSIISRLWIDANKSLSQWNSLLDVVGDVKDAELRLEILGKANEWGQVADIMSQYDWSTRSWSKIFAAYLALSFSDSCHSGPDAPLKQRLFLADMEASINRSYHNLVACWNTLPSGCDRARDLLLMCQEFVEFNESANLVTEIRGAITGSKPSYPTPKQLLNTWRDRLPDEYDSISSWFEILNLRMIIFRHIQQQCSVDVVAASHIAPYLHDYPWSLVKLAHVASRAATGVSGGGIASEMAQVALQKFQASITRSTDAFNNEFFDALREQIRLYRISSNSDDWRIGLNVLNCCVISNSNSQQASEVSWMQGRLLARLGQLEEAKSALLVAVNTYPMIAGAWMSLGDALYDSGDRNEECLMAYMQALALKGSKAVKLVPRILSLVDEFQLTSLAEKCLDAQPSSVWIFWVPLLVQSVSSPVASPALIATGKAILKKISITFPQSVFYALKSGCISDRDQLVAHMKADSRGETIYKALEEMCEYFVEKFATWSDQEISVVAVANALDELRITGSVRRTRLPPGQSATEAGLVKFLDKSVQSSDSGIEVHAFPVNSLVSRISGVMEIMGNYTRYISVPHGSTLESMSSVLVAGVDSHYRIVRDLCGEAGYIRVPVITFIGTNGLRYSYTVRPQVSPRVAGTTSIVYGVLNSVFAHHSQTKQRDVQIRSLQQVPLSENIVLREYRSDIKSYERIITTSGESDDLLVSYFSSSSSVDFYEKSKKFTKSVAANGVTDYLLGIGGDRRTRNEICVSQRDGFLVMLDSDLRIRASLKDPDVPFGLPVFAQNAIGERNMVGLLPATMRAVADSVHSKPRHVFELLALLSKLNEQENIAHGARKRLDHLVDQTGHLCHTIMDLINSAVNI